MLSLSLSHTHTLKLSYTFTQIYAYTYILTYMHTVIHSYKKEKNMEKIYIDKIYDNICDGQFLLKIAHTHAHTDTHTYM